MKILIMTDMEGCAGILDHDNWVMPNGRYYDAGQMLLTEEVNAAIAGFLAGGAREVLVVDGHGAGGIDPVRLHPDAQLLHGFPDPAYPFLLDDTFAGIAWVGQHAKAGTDYSHITHTEWFDHIDMSVNGLSIGEFGEMALCAMELGVPSIFSAGEEAFCWEAEALTPGIITVSVKRGLHKDGLAHLSMDEYRAAKLSAVHLSPTQARQRIEAGARTAIDTLRATPQVFRYPALHAPYTKQRILRGDPVREEWASHPDSLIALMNAPWEKVSARSGS